MPPTSSSDQRQAVEFARKCFNEWKIEAVVAYYDEWLSKEDSQLERSDHLMPPGPKETEGSLFQEWRYRGFLDREIELQAQAGRMSLHKSHSLMGANRARGRSIRAVIESNPEFHRSYSLTQPVQAQVIEEPEKEVVSQIVEEEVVAASVLPEDAKPEKEVPAVNWLEVLLDPRSLQYLMMLGAVLLVIGTVIYLATQGFFEDPLVIAVGCAIGNLLLLAGGIALVQKERFRSAGRGVMLLACMFMPFHLWFYDAQGLIVLEDGGHLWIPALMIAALYAACAYLIRDTLFVYTMLGGITLTGLLILGDQDVARFWHGAASATLLIGLGAMAIHVERAFLPGDGPFSREQFGKAFYNAGHVVLGMGLFVLICWTGSAWTYDMITRVVAQISIDTVPFDRPALASHTPMKFWAFALTVLTCYSYLYSYVAVSRSVWLVLGTLFTVLWSELLLVDTLSVGITEEFVILLLSINAIIAHGLHYWNVDTPRTKSESESPEVAGFRALTSIMGTILVVVPLFLGILGYLRANFDIFSQRELTWMYVVAMVVTAVACRLGAYVSTSDGGKSVPQYFVGTAVATLLAVFGLLWNLEFRTWDINAPILMLLPIVYLVVAHFYTGEAKRGLTYSAMFSTGLLLAIVIAAAVGIGPERRFEPPMGSETNLWLSLFFLEAGVFYAMLSQLSKRPFGVHMATACVSGAVWQWLNYANFSAEVYLLVFGGIGLAMLALYRASVVETMAGPAVAKAIFQSGNSLLSLAGTGTALLALNRLFADQMISETLVVLIPMIVGTIVAAYLVAEESWRRWYWVLAFGQGIVGVLLVTIGIDLTWWQKVEIFGMVCGAALLIAAHVGWSRESDDRKDWVSLGLGLGSLAFIAPIGIGLLMQRLGVFVPDGNWTTVHEVVVLAASLVFVGSGVLLKIRATTITGTTSLMIYMATLLVYVRLPEQLQHVAVYMIIGGAAFFSVALLLSIYRDHLLALPQHYKTRQGMFRVMSWR